MALSTGNGGKLNYTGRCSLARRPALGHRHHRLFDANHRYEAVMNSGIGGFRGVAIGQKLGDKIVFDLQQRADDDAGNDISIAVQGDPVGGNTHRRRFPRHLQRQRRQHRRQVPFTKA